MWHDDSWQPYGDYDAPATSSWRHHHHMGPPVMQGAPLYGGGGRMHAGYPRQQYQPYARPMPPHNIPPQHSPTLAGASREMSWRNANDGWGPPPPPLRMRNGAAPWHSGVAPEIPALHAHHHHHHHILPHHHPLHAAALSKLSSVEITTPHAGGELRAKPIVCEKRAADDDEEDGDDLQNGAPCTKRALYSDFSAPDQPKVIRLRFERTAIRITVSWTFPDLPALYKYKQKIEVRDNLTIIEEDTLAAHITSFRFKTTPGGEYHVKLTVVDAKGVVVAAAKETDRKDKLLLCRAIFSLDEIDRMIGKAMDFTGTAMQPFSFLYRCKPKIYWDDIYLRRNGIMERYMKDNNGQAASPINGEISGMFFSAKTLADGSLPPSSPFGDIRMILPAISLLDPSRISAFFCDFYCNRLTHYVTVVICEQGSQTEKFCQEKLRSINLADNRFLRITPTNNPNMPYAFFVNRSVWVEVYYTENIPMHWGRFDHIFAMGAGTSKIGGVPHNKSCLTCNLYPVGPQPGVSAEPVEDLVASYENIQAQKSLEDGSGYLFPRNSTRYTALGCIQAELLAPSSSVSADISKEDYLEVAEVIVYCVDYVAFEQSYENLGKFNNAIQSPEKVQQFATSSISSDSSTQPSRSEQSPATLNLPKLEQSPVTLKSPKLEPSLSTNESPNLKLSMATIKSPKLEPSSTREKSPPKSVESLITAKLSTDTIRSPPQPQTTATTLTAQTIPLSSSPTTVQPSTKVQSPPSADTTVPALPPPTTMSPSSSKLMSVLDGIDGKLPANVPMVANLVAKIKALVKEMDHAYGKINTDIDAKL